MLQYSVGYSTAKIDKTVKRVIFILKFNNMNTNSPLQPETRLQVGQSKGSAINLNVLVDVGVRPGHI